MRILALCAALALSACSTLTLDASPAQRLYDAKGTYREFVEPMAVYAKDCEASPPVVRADCLPVVAELQRLDLAVQAAEDRAEAVVAGGGDASLALSLLTEAVNELEAYLIEQAIEGETP